MEFRWGEKEREEGRREEEENPGLELWFGTLVFVSMEPICMVLLVRKPSLLFLCLCLGFEEPYLYIKVISIGFSSVLWLVFR